MQKKKTNVDDVTTLLKEDDYFCFGINLKEPNERIRIRLQIRWKIKDIKRKGMQDYANEEEILGREETAIESKERIKGAKERTQ